MKLSSPLVDAVSTAADLRARGTPFVLAIVVRATAPTSAKPGDKALLTEDGLLVGWIGGSCAEPIVRREAQAALRDGECRLLHITPDAEVPANRNGLSVHRMECYSGGSMDIYVEPYLPLPRLLVFGNSPVARALCDLGRVMKYAVTVVDLGERPSMGPDVEALRSLDDLGPVDPRSTFAVVSSHGVFDDVSLEKALSLDLAYVGLVASHRRRDQVLQNLAAKGVSAGALGRIAAPAGLDLGARQPEEIALSVMAQIVSVRRAHKAVAEPEVSLATGVTARPQPLPVGVPSLAIVVPLEPPAAKSCCHGNAAAGK